MNPNPEIILLPKPKRDTRPWREQRCNNIGDWLVRSSRNRNRGRRLITYGTIKAERLRVKNERRAANGLAPRTSYAQV